MRKIKYDFITVDSTAIQSMRYYKEQRNLLVKFQNDTNYNIIMNYFNFQNISELPIKKEIIQQKTNSNSSVGKALNIIYFTTSSVISKLS